MSLIAIIIPCFNEEKRLASDEINHFLRLHANYHFIFVNDGSTDGTEQVMTDIQTNSIQQVVILKIKMNKGKANAVREGFLFCLQQKKYAYIGYWDADLSTGFSELLRMTDIVIGNNLEFAFGSRMKKLNTAIKRSGFRHLAGRLITTIIDSHFNLGIYDTQCGAKMFSAAITEIISREAFVTNWLFDIEIFLRIREHSPKPSGEEISLLSWTSQPGSKINVLNTPVLCIELIKLIRRYPKNKVNG